MREYSNYQMPFMHSNQMEFDNMDRIIGRPFGFGRPYGFGRPFYGRPFYGGFAAPFLLGTAFGAAFRPYYYPYYY